MFAAQACGLTFPAFMQDFGKFLLPWSMHMAGQRHADLQVGSGDLLRHLRSTNSTRGSRAIASCLWR